VRPRTQLNQEVASCQPPTASYRLEVDILLLTVLAGIRMTALGWSAV
jgi:hypothetical protein